MKKIICILLAFVLTIPLCGMAAPAEGKPAEGKSTGSPAAPKDFKAAQGMANQIDVSYKTVKGAKGYQIAVSTSGKFPKTKTTTIDHKGNKTGLTSKALKNVTGDTIKKCKGKKLKAGATYHVRVRAYKTDNGKKIFGRWIGAKTVKAANKNNWPKTKTIRYLGKTWTYSRIDPYTIPDGFGGKTKINGRCSYHTNNATGKPTKDCLGRHYGSIFCAKAKGGEKELLKNICSNCERPGCAKRITCKKCDKCHGGAIGGWENCYRDKVRDW